VIRKEDTVARLGGDEFVVFLTALDSDPVKAAEAAMKLGEKLLAAISEPMIISSSRVGVTPSIGVAVVPGDGVSPADLMKSADVALYRSKAAGRNACTLFTEEMLTSRRESIELENSLRDALAAKEFDLHYQPQVDEHFNIVGAEALLRWSPSCPSMRSRKEIRSANVFIPVLESSGLIIPVGWWVLEEACTTLRWLLSQKLVGPDFVMSVNISSVQFLHVDFVDRVTEIMKAAGVSGRSLKLEITESLMIGDVSASITKMKALREIGVSFAIDDFGTGYSSLSYVKEMPVNTLKIDQVFVRDFADSPSDQKIVSAIISLGGSFDMDIMAEGVETLDQHGLLVEMGCRLFQGYWVSRALPLDDFASFAKTSIAAKGRRA
jgi:EAL domain-containing protein (putative c-di-GMP-specific phosphodiesterase class I)